MPTPPGHGASTYEFDPAVALAHLQGADPVLASLIRDVGPFALRIRPAPTTFGSLAEALVYQQLSRKAAASIFGRVGALFGTDVRWPEPEQILSVDEATLRGAGLSRAKALSVRDLALKVQQGVVPSLERLRGMDDEEVVACLTQVIGIGRWTAEMFLIFRLGRPDVFPVGDLGLRRGYERAYQPDGPADAGLMTERAVRWQPYRTVATWYLWQSLEPGGGGVVTNP